MLKRSVEYFSVLSILVFIVSLSNLGGYFYEFSISASNFFSISEIFINAIRSVLGMALLALAIFLRILLSRPRYIELNEIFEEPFQIRKTWFDSPLVSIIIGFSGVTIIYFRKEFLITDLSIVTLAGVAIAYAIISQMFFTSYPTLPTFKSMFLLYFIAASALISIEEGHQKAISVKALGNDINVIFRFHNHNYSTGTSLVYVGMSENSIFLYDSSSKATTILDRKEIDSLVMYRRN